MKNIAVAMRRIEVSRTQRDKTAGIELLAGVRAWPR